VDFKSEPIQNIIAKKTKHPQNMKINIRFSYNNRNSPPNPEFKSKITTVNKIAVVI
jgi:hypothetical protein